MKKILFIALAAALCSFAAYEYEVKKCTAEVNQYQGLYIFIQSRPICNYQVIGTVKKTGIVWSGSPNEMLNTLVRRCKKDFPAADGIIFDDLSMEHGTCVKFKD